MLFGIRRVENERNRFVNESIQIEKRNYQVWVFKALHISSVDNTLRKFLKRES